MMSQRQRWLYWREVKAARAAILKSGSPPSDENEWRHALHVRALGRDKSSTDFTNADLDKVLGELRAISQPGNLSAQLRQLNQERGRLLFGIRQEARHNGQSEAYIQAIIDRMDADGHLLSGPDEDAPPKSDWDRALGRSTPQRKLEELSPEELRKVRIALSQHERRDSRALAHNYELRPA